MPKYGCTIELTTGAMVEITVNISGRLVANEHNVSLAFWPLASDTDHHIIM